ncbi:cytochrome b-c1 complex subunit 7-like [Lingula anatina]|uniref:Cytochrome b-c1 complex subunit 7 n=1 Tax=Lingula anatina TaxID=7574 RepID=A0A1S3JJX7_LINAN|nr:cytochrome b-c1 complex subunit 7 [Lingula anatina]XP_013410441.1 cytochrome b-c1 complex subunit 7-like [Lingula anatina]|eukprot:XP_013391059.1 cytochrome b-c1 complex subunit 7 [Lingula anatina]
MAANKLMSAVAKLAPRAVQGGAKPTSMIPNMKIGTPWAGLKTRGELVEAGLMDESELSEQHKNVFNFSYFPEVGLMWDDLAYGRDPTVREALRRLPPDVHAARMVRISRALLLSAQRKVLPEEEWTTLESDIPYMAPYIEQVKREKEEMKEWKSKD